MPYSIYIYMYVIVWYKATMEDPWDRGPCQSGVRWLMWDSGNYITFNVEVQYVCVNPLEVRRTSQ